MSRGAAGKYLVSWVAITGLLTTVVVKKFSGSSSPPAPVAQKAEEDRGYVPYAYVPPHTPTVEVVSPTPTESYKGGFDVGVLYWKSKQNSLYFTTHSESVLTTSDFTEGKLKKPHYSYEPGFWLAAEYPIEDSAWSLSASFVYYQGRMKGSKEVLGNDGIFPVLSIAEDTLPSDYVTSAKVHGTLDVNILDLISSYTFTYSSWFSLFPLLAVRDVRIVERIHATYEGGTYSAGADKVRMKSRFYGAGPLVGVVPQFALCDSISLYAEASLAYLMGRFRVHERETFLSTPRDSLKRNFFGGRWNGNLSVGFTFSEVFKKPTTKVRGFELDLGFDYLVFTRQYAFKHGSAFTLPHHGKSLTLYGAHLALGANF